MDYLEAFLASARRSTAF